MPTLREKSPVDPLSAVPIVPEDVAVVHLVNAPGLRLSRTLPPSNRFSAWLERRFHLSRKQRYDLDALGKSFFLAIDGKRTLSEIEVLLRTDHQFTFAESRHAVIQFTKTLMRRGLVDLRLAAEGTIISNSRAYEHRPALESGGDV